MYKIIKMYQGGKSKKRQGKDDVKWIYRSKLEYMESLGIEFNSNVYATHREEMDRLVEIKIYGERYYLDTAQCANFIINLNKGQN